MRFLIIDDDPEYRRFLRYHVEAEWPDALIDDYQPGGAGLPAESLALGELDLILLGFPLAEDEGRLRWLHRLRRRSDCPPVIVFASGGDEFLAVDALKAGAADYFPKARVAHRRLIQSIRDCVRRAEPAEATESIFATGPFLRGLKRCRFLAKLHSGDLASVYLAESEETGERLVFKVLRHVPDAGGGRPFDRFLQEYEAVARVEHPNVVRIYDLGVADDHAYIAMEYLSAGSLAERLTGPISAETALEYARQVARALGAIHRAGILHRDLKPANVMFREDGTLALIDFGLAKQVRLEVAITATGQIFGTPYYMSPEQGHAEPVDERSDIYGLGCILYEMLTGNRPFLAGSPMAVIYKHAHAPRPALGGDLRALQPLLDRMLAVDPGDRYQSAQELVRALDAAGLPREAGHAG
jgi:DNA-binding response OmpR family regulator